MLPALPCALALACGALSLKLNASSPSDQQLRLETKWRLTRLIGRSIREPKRDPLLTLNLKDGRVFGFAGCNEFSARYRVDGLKLRFSRVTTTRKGCVGIDAAKTEEGFLQVLPRVRSWKIEGTVLLLRDSSGRAVLTYEHLD